MTLELNLITLQFLRNILELQKQLHQITPLGMVLQLLLLVHLQFILATSTERLLVVQLVLPLQLT